MAVRVLEPPEVRPRKEGGRSRTDPLLDQLRRPIRDGPARVGQFDQTAPTAVRQPHMATQRFVEEPIFVEGDRQVDLQEQVVVVITRGARQPQLPAFRIGLGTRLRLDRHRRPHRPWRLGPGGSDPVPSRSQRVFIHPAIHPGDFHTHLGNTAVQRSVELRRRAAEVGSAPEPGRGNGSSATLPADARAFQRHSPGSHLQADADKPVVRSIFEHLERFGEIVHHQVRIPIVIHVTRDHRHGDGSRLIQTQGFRLLLKPTVGGLNEHKQPVFFGTVEVRQTDIARFSLILKVLSISRRNQQIHPPIPIDVQPHRPPTPPGSGQTFQCSHLVPSHLGSIGYKYRVSTDLPQ